MPLNFADATAKCPFLQTKSQKTITCEGLVKNSTIILSFKGTSQKYTETFCDDEYENCPICRMLMETKYEEK